MAKAKFHCTKDEYPHRYACEQAIKRHILRMRRVRNHVPTLLPYLCTNCNKWHITSDTH